MTLPTPLYNLRRPCAKCGEVGTKDSFRRSLPSYGGDFISRVCTNCGHEWHERPLDATPLDAAEAAYQAQCRQSDLSWIRVTTDYGPGTHWPHWCAVRPDLSFAKVKDGRCVHCGDRIP